VAEEDLAARVAVVLVEAEARGVVAEEEEEDFEVSIRRSPTGRFFIREAMEH
jgi:hypothetical protein